MSALLEGGEIIQTLEERLLGRLAGRDIRDPVTGEIIVSFNEEIDEEQAKAVVEAGVDRVKIRSVLTCPVRAESVDCVMGATCRAGVWSRRVSRLVLLRQSIGEPGTQLTMRTFHIGGTASKVVEQTVLEANARRPFEVHEPGRRRMLMFTMRDCKTKKVSGRHESQCQNCDRWDDSGRERT